MANGLPRTQKYQHLDAERHLFYLDNDLDTMDVKMEERDADITAQLAKMSNTLVWILRTFVLLLITALGALVTVVITNAR